MHLVRLGKHYPDPLKLPVAVNPLNRTTAVPLKRLDYLLGMLSTNDLFPEYVQNLSDKYLSLAKDVPFHDFMFPGDFKNLHAHPALFLGYLKYCIGLLGVSPDEIKTDTTVENRDYLRAFLFPDYYNLLVLTETLGRSAAISLWKRYITHYIIDNREQRSLDDVSELFERRNQGNRDSEWVLVHGVIDEGKYAYKNENCTWVEAMKSLPDPELKYLVCCYGDYEHARTNDPNLMLTMEHTIAEGDPYCSRVLHDVRVNWDLTHPSKKFWDGFNPEE